MNSKKLNNVMLMISLCLNMLLAAGMLGLGLNARRAMLGLITESATTEIQIQEYMLAELKSDQPERVEALKSVLRLNIDVAKRMRYKIGTGVNP